MKFIINFPILHLFI